MAYNPSRPPVQADNALAKWAEEEFRIIARQFNEFEILRLTVLNVVPTKPRNGMIAYADGTNWNPGSGEGPYAYINGVWTKLFP